MIFFSGNTPRKQLILLGWCEIEKLIIILYIYHQRPQTTPRQLLRGYRLCVLLLLRGTGSLRGARDLPECWSHTFPGPRPAANAFGAKPHHGLRLRLLGNELRGPVCLCVCFLSSWACVTVPTLCLVNNAPLTH